MYGGSFGLSREGSQNLHRQKKLGTRRFDPEQARGDAFSIASEIEQGLISQHIKEALRYKKEQGIKLGRPIGPGKSTLYDFRPEIEALLKSGTTQKFSAQRYKATEATVSN